MRSYVNKDGERIEVSESHIRASIKIKKELQKLSPSRRCSWSKHKILMKKEGFDDSCTCEAYRGLVKDEQRKRGLLPQLEKHADIIASNKLESIKEAVGEMYFEKRENQNVLKELNKLKREIVDSSVIFSDIVKSLSDYNWSEFKMPKVKISHSKKSKSKMIVTLSDMHIGALVDLDVNKFNYDVAKERMTKYLIKILEKCEKENITEVYVMNLGDVIEHSTMRYSQGFDVEFKQSEQIVKASDLIIKFLFALADSNLNVSYSGIAGNHDRIDGDKNKNISGDHVVRVVNKIIETSISFSKKDNIKFIKAKDYKHSFSVNGRNVLAIHGDLDNINDDNILMKHSILDNKNYDTILAGHYHTRMIKEIGDNRFILVSGSLKGSDRYSIEKIKKISSASQSFYVVDENGELSVNSVSF